MKFSGALFLTFFGAVSHLAYVAYGQEFTPVSCFTPESGGSCGSLEFRFEASNGDPIKIDEVLSVAVISLSPSALSLRLPESMLRVLDNEILSISDREAVYRRVAEINGSPALSIVIGNDALQRTFTIDVPLSRTDGAHTFPDVEHGTLDAHLQYLSNFERDLLAYPLEIAPKDRFKFVALANYGMYVEAASRNGPTHYSYPVFSAAADDASEIGKIEIRFSRDGFGAPSIDVAFVQDGENRSTILPHRTTSQFQDQFAFDVTLLASDMGWRKIGLPEPYGSGWIGQSGGSEGFNPFASEIVFGAVDRAFDEHDGYHFYGQSYVFVPTENGSVRLRPVQLSESQECGSPDLGAPDCLVENDENWLTINWRSVYTDDGRLIYSPHTD